MKRMLEKKSKQRRRRCRRVTGSPRLSDLASCSTSQTVASLVSYSRSGIQILIQPSFLFSFFPPRSWSFFHFFKVVLRDSFLGFLKVFQSLSLAAFSIIFKTVLLPCHFQRNVFFWFDT